MPGEDNKPVYQEVNIITNTADYEDAMVLWKINKKMKETEWQKFINNKELLLDLVLEQVDQTIKHQLTSLPEYKQVKKDQYLIGTMNCLCNRCYSNKDGGMSFQPYVNMKLRKKNMWIT